jgi:hypothetical protein
MKLYIKSFYGLFLLVGLAIVFTVVSFAETTEKPVDLNFWNSVMPTPPPFFKCSPINVYDSKTIYELIDGGADVYLEYGFKNCFQVKYLNANDKDYIDLEIYEMKDNLNAFGIFANECYLPVKELIIGAAGYQQDETLNFYQGKYYIKLYANSPKLIPELYPLGFKISSALGAESPKIEMLELFPRENAVALSQKMLANGFLGIKTLPQTWTTDYTLGKKSCTLFLKEASSTEDANSLFSKFAKQMKSLSQKYKKLDSITKESFSCKDELDRTILACRQGRFIAGVIGAGELPEKELLLKLVSKLKKHE